MMEIIVILLATPPAMAPAFELCPTIGKGVAEFEEEPRGTLLVEYDEEFDAGVEGCVIVGPVEADPEGPDGPKIVPGPSSGVSERSKMEV
jgi:hypothetical protein